MDSCTFFYKFMLFHTFSPTLDYGRLVAIRQSNNMDEKLVFNRFRTHLTWYSVQLILPGSQRCRGVAQQGAVRREWLFPSQALHQL